MIDNIILKTDSYKPTQWKQYPPGTTSIYSYFESRQTETPITFFGLQKILKKSFIGCVVTSEQVESAKNFFELHFGRDDAFNYEGWMTIATELGGVLPLRIKSVPEGTTVPGSNVLFTVQETDSRFFWLVNYVESILSHVWYASTIATNSRLLKELLDFYAVKTATDTSTSFQMHDFGYRGVSSDETAGIGGLAHLLWFLGTDNIESLVTAMNFYGETAPVGFSIPATEHSTMTTWGVAREVEAMRAMLTTYPTGAIACVCDSYDIMRAIETYGGGELRELIMNRDGVFVFRPDSGDPVVSTVKVIDALWNAFGGAVNEKGYKVLHPTVRMIQGDGVDLSTVREILKMFEFHGYSSENIAFGSGGGLLQKFNRDTFKFAFKCSSAIIDGVEVDVRKTPLEWKNETQYVKSFKESKQGMISLYKTPQADYYTSIAPRSNEDVDCLQLIFENGKLLIDETFTVIRTRALGN